MTAPARHLTVVPGGFIDENGEVISPEVASLRERVAQLEADLKGAEKDLRAKRRQLTELLRDKARERLDYERYADVERIAKYWWRKCRGSSPQVHYMSPDRFDAVRGILDQKELVVDPHSGKRKWRAKYTLEDCKAAVDGAALDHYVSKRKNGTDQHHDDLELVFRNGSKFEEFVARAPLPRLVPFVPAGRDLFWR